LILKVVFDTNIFISAFILPGGRAEAAFLAAIEADFELLTSTAILAETAGKLAEKFDWEEEMVIRAIKLISSASAEVLRTDPSIHSLSDEADNRILECAVEGKASIIVTGDKHLLALRRYGDIRIMRLTDFLEMLAERKSPS
jgi:putative PIN family toxin of toxin-antitoxin system